MKEAFKRYSFDVANSNERVAVEFDLPTEAVKFTGIRFDADREQQLYARGEARVEIANEEIFPDQMPIKFLMFGSDAQTRMHFIDVDNKTNKMKITFQDVNTTAQPFAAYKVSILIRYETK